MIRAAIVDRNPKGGNNADWCRAKHESGGGEANRPNDTAIESQRQAA
jgi:hypothetical protein